MDPVLMCRLSKPLLFLAAFIWGTSFFIMKNTLDAVPVLWLLTFRFTTGAVLVGLLCGRKWRTRFTPDYVWPGAVLGSLLFAAYAVQTFGLVGTTPSKNAFLTATYCVLVPFLYWLVARQRPDRYNILAALLCISGVGLVSLTESFTVTRGDALTLCCAVFYASHIVSVAKVSPGKDIYILTVFQFFWAAVYAWVCGLLFQQFPPVETLLNTDMVIQMGYLIVMATTVALLFQNVGQVWSDPASASVILSLESVFGVLCSVIFYGDPVTGRLLAGFALIFVAVVCSETKFSFLRRKSEHPAQSVG